MATVNLKKLPSPKEIGSITVGSLFGGLNIRSEPTEVGSAQSPDMLNMWYADGLLRKRHGQREYFIESDENRDSGRVWFYDKLFNGYVLYQDGDEFRYFMPGDDEPLTVLGVTAPDQEHGTFFPFDEYVFYKANGVYIRFRIDDTTGDIVGEYIVNGSYISDKVYTPVIAINRKPTGAGGDLYQPENRINPDKWVWFDIDGKSTDYYLPVHGCDVLKVQIEDEVTDTADKTTRTFDTDLGIRFTIEGEELSDGSTEYTKLHMSTPVYIDETGWNGTDWSDSESKGGNFLDNVVWSGVQVPYANDDYKAALKNGDVLFGTTEQHDLPEEFRYNLIDMARSRCPYEQIAGFFVLDNGKYCNFFFANDTYNVNADQYAVDDPSNEKYPWDIDNAPACRHVIKEYKTQDDEGNTTDEIIVHNCYMVSYSYRNKTWKTTDYTDKPSTGWNYAGNKVYATCDFTVGNFKPPMIVIPKGGIEPDVLGEDPTWLKLYGEKYTRYRRVVQTLIGYARERLTDWGNNNGYNTDANRLNDENAPLLYISENENIYVLRYILPSEVFWVTEYDSDNGYFKAKNYAAVSIRKDNPYDITISVTKEAGKWGMYASNIIWASEDIIYYGDVSYEYALPSSLEGEYSSIDDVPEEYRDQVALAIRRAHRDYGTSLDTPVVIAKKGQYFVVHIPTPGMCVTELDVKTSEFKGTGFYVEAYNASKDIDIDIDFATPAVLSNKVRVLYRKRNDDAFNAIMSCGIATSYGGNSAMCAVVAGCEKQPNAIFWSGNGTYGVDPTYFPMDQYNLCGTYQDPVIGFGKQQSHLIIFQTSHISRASYNIESISGRSRIDLPVVNINSEKGCDRPWSIRLCGNNLVWVHSKYGVMYIKDSSSSYENQIITISDNVNGSNRRPGLLKDIEDANTVFAIDDGKRYMVFVGDKMYCWDHAITNVGEDGVYGLSWTKHSGFDCEAGFEIDSGGILLMSKDGGIREFNRECDTDCEEPIPCHYTTPTQNFGGLYRKRTIKQVLLTALSDKGGEFTVRCGSERVVPLSDELKAPTRPMYPSVIVEREFPTPFVYKPRLFGINHMWVRVESDGHDGGLSIDGITILYTTQDKVR